MPAKPDVLYLTHRVPYPPDKGDRIRNYHILRFLSKHASVHLLCLADEPVTAEAAAVLRGLCKRLCIVPMARVGRWFRALGSVLRGNPITQGAFHSLELSRTLDRWCQSTQFHAALTSASSMAPYLERLRFVQTFVDLMDVDSQKWFDYAGSRSWPMSAVFRMEGRRMRDLEESLAYWAHGLILTTEVEADICRSFCPTRHVHAVTNGVDLNYFQPAPAVEEDGCIFVGALDYYPNVDAALWFGREVWPHIRRVRPEARWTLVGRRPVKALRKLVQNTPGVELAADVPDVRVYLRRASVVIVPLHIARGVQNKLLEALAAGKAVVASPQALAGVKALPDRDLLSATSPTEWAESVDRLLSDAALRQRLGQSGRRFVEEHHDWNRCLQPLSELLRLEGQPVVAPVSHQVPLAALPSFSI